jgi:methyl-accepting chemotaxis protein
MFKQTRQNAKRYLNTILTILQAISDGFQTLTARTVEQTRATQELTAAVKDAANRADVCAGRIDAATASLAYLEGDRRTHNDRAGLRIAQ